MNRNEIKIYVERELAKKIREKMVSIYSLLAMDSFGKYATIKELSQLITELLSNNDTQKRFIDLANESIANGNNNDAKFRTFEVIRNIVSHFPFFEKWDDVFITNNLLNWDGNNYRGIKNYFRDNANQTLVYEIYMKMNGNWEVAHTVKMNVLPIDDENAVFMKDMITEEDVIWTFCIIDCYLDYMGFGLDTRSSTSI